MLLCFQVIQIDTTVGSIDEQLNSVDFSALSDYGITVAKDAVDAAKSALQGVQADIHGIVNIVTNKMKEISDTYRPPTLAVEQKWRFIPIAVLFGLTILLSAILAIAVWKMTWPKATAFTVMLLWLDVALLLLLGAGEMVVLHQPSKHAGFICSIHSPFCRPSGWGQDCVH